MIETSTKYDYKVYYFSCCITPLAIIPQHFNSGSFQIIILQQTKQFKVVEKIKFS
jgi:hypothetical protein